MEKMIADRIVTVRTREHTRASQIAARDGRILLTQEFRGRTPSREISGGNRAARAPDADAVRQRDRSSSSSRRPSAAAW